MCHILGSLHFETLLLFSPCFFLNVDLHKIIFRFFWSSCRLMSWIVYCSKCNIMVLVSFIPVFSSLFLFLCYNHVGSFFSKVEF